MSEDPAVSQDTNSKNQGLLAKASAAVSGAETGLLTLALALLVSIPLLERLLRHFTDTGISGASDFVQHLSLVIAMLGGAVAAREDRLLSISTLSQVVSERWKNYIKIISNSIAAAITIYLGIASIELITTEREAESLIAYGIRIWMVQLIIPAGFAAIAIRILWNTGNRWPWDRCHRPRYHSWGSHLHHSRRRCSVILLGGGTPHLNRFGEPILPRRRGDGAHNSPLHTRGFRPG